MSQTKIMDAFSFFGTSKGMSELHVLKMKINNNSVGDSDDIDMAASDFSHSYGLWKLSVKCLNNSISDHK
jgi:hypothetical protein